MMPLPLPVTEADLHAYVDGRLPPARAAEVDAYLAAHPEDAARVQAHITQNAALRAMFDPVLDEPVPPRLATRPPRRRWLGLAAGMAIAIVSGAAGWGLRGASGDDMGLASGGGQSAYPAPAVAGLARRAAVAHVVYSPDVRRPVEIGADQEDQLVAWLSNRLGSRIRPPHLGKVGYELIGGRLLPGASGPVAQFMYHDGAGQRLTLYVSSEQAHNKDTGFRFAREGPVNVFYWIDGQFGYALSAGADRNELARVAGAVHEQLDARVQVKER
ncbi:anti-sigma factor family protein [Massilia niastensis]|uniref:anti-sigma factor family protein n=1 Tax=Massilia niastensis TaxID=544911 RepID=UPI0003770D3D|nr:anti-sigma factor [Massilia niastensis]